MPILFYENKAINYQLLNSKKHISRHKRVSEYSVTYYVITCCLLFDLYHCSGTNYFS